MRIERTGRVAPLTPRLIQFMVEALHGRSIDEMQAPEEERIDYICMNGLLAVEVKSLEHSSAVRLENLTDELSEREDWPDFLGSMSMELIIRRMKDPEELRRRLFNRVGRAIVNHLKKANSQLGAHQRKFPRKNLVRIVLLINEDHEDYDPETVANIVLHALNRKRGDVPLYENVDAVVYITERHAQAIDGRVAFPVMRFEGMAMSVWKEGVLDYFVRAWAVWNSTPLHASSDDALGFSTVEHIPEKAPRHERWRIEYRRRPYMRDFTDEMIRECFDECIVISMLAFIKGSPMKIPREATTINMEKFTHIMMEMNRRGLTLADVRYEPRRIVAASLRIGLPSDIAAWLIERHSTVPNAPPSGK